MKPAEKRKKGQRFERAIAKDIEAEGLGKAGREAMSGGGFRKGDIASNLDFLIECKNQKTIHFLDWVDQAKSQAMIGNQHKEKWLLTIRDPRTPEHNSQVYAVIDWFQLLKLLKKDKEPRIKEPDREFKYKVERLYQSAKDVMKIIKP